MGVTVPRTLVAVATLVALTSCTMTDPRPVTEDGRFPVTVMHRFGETEVDGPPQRVAVFSGTDQDTVLALGVLPYATGGHSLPVPPWRRARVTELQRRFGVETPPREAIGQPSVADVLPRDPAPDQIVGVSSGMGPADYDEDTAVAPTIGPAVGPESYGGRRSADIRQIGRALGKPIEAERLIAGTESRFAAVRERFPQLVGRTAVCAGITTGKGATNELQVEPAGPLSSCSWMLGELGMRGVPSLTPGVAVTKEQMSAARPDLVVLDNYVAGARDATWRYRLPAGLAVVDPGDDGAAVLAEGPTVLSLPTDLDTVVPRLARAPG